VVPRSASLASPRRARTLRNSRSTCRKTWVSLLKPENNPSSGSEKPSLITKAAFV